MNRTIKRVLSALVIIISITAVIIIAFSNPEMKNAWKALASMDLKWVLGLFLCWAAYAGFEGVGTWSYLRSKGYKINLGRVIGVALIGFYYSNITPSAAGGQPMQVNSLRKAGIPVAYGTTAVTIRFVSNQLTICMMTLGLLIANRTFAYSQLGGLIWAARIGWAINFIAVPLVLLAAFKRNLIQAVIEWLISLLAKMHLVRDKKATIAKITEILDSYHAAMIALIHSPGQILMQILFSALSMLGMTGSIVFTYYAFGLSGTPWYQILTMSCLLFVSASYTPLPGASGAQEGGFMAYFAGIFTDGTIGVGLLIWRFFTYYMFLIVGVGTVLNDKRLIRREKKRKQAEERLSGAANPAAGNTAPETAGGTEDEIQE